jgi:LPS-assembly protein
MEIGPVLTRQRSFVLPKLIPVLRSFFIVISFLIFAVFSGQFVHAQQMSAKIQDILVNADTFYRDSEKEIIDLQGNVQIVYKGQHIKADRALIHIRSKQVETEGHVEIVSEKNTIGGDRIVLDYESNTGLIYNGFVQSGNVRFQGSLLQKTGADEYYVSDADYTACTNCPATWSFSGSTVRAELGGYAYIKNSILRVGGVPVLWLPYLVVPLKSDRQSGLLTPGFEKSDKGGFAFSQPFFWAISRSTDATITAKNYERRGLKGLINYRYALTEDSQGELDFGDIYDKAFGLDPRLNTFRSPNDVNDPVDRWFVRYNHYYDMPEGYIERVQLNLASDLQYPKDFPTETLNHGDSAMENRMSITKNTKDQHYSMDSSYYVNMLHSNPLEGNEDAVHRLPELRFSQVQQNIGNSDFLFSMDLDYVNFARSGNAYDDMTSGSVGGTKLKYPTNTSNSPTCDQDPKCHYTQDGQYNPGTDMIRTGQRLDFVPRVTYPIRFGDGVDILPSVSYRETRYQFNIDQDDSHVRRYLRTDIGGRMTFSRIYGDMINTKATRYKHEFNPEVAYTVIPWLDEAAHPFFGVGELKDAPYSSRDSISDGDTGSDYGLQFDYNDRIYNRNLVTFGLVNKIVEKRWVGDRPEYKQIALFRIAQSYDASQATKDKAEPYSDVVATLDVRLDHFQTYSTFNYFPYQKVTNSSTRIRGITDKGEFAQLASTQQYKITPGQPVDYNSRTDDYAVSAGVLSRYLNLMGRIVYDANWQNSDNKQKFKSWAYIAQFKPPGDCWLITFIHDQVTGGDTNIRLGFEFTFDGTPKPPLPPETLDSFGF